MWADFGPVRGPEGALDSVSFEAGGMGGGRNARAPRQFQTSMGMMRWTWHDEELPGTEEKAGQLAAGRGRGTR
jgi:hypothetical protein